MRKFKPLEWIFLGIGLSLAVGSGLLFFFEAENIGIYLGFLVESKQTTLGKLEYSVADTMRKSANSQNFVALSRQQKVYDHDTIMTTEGGEAVLSLLDGGSIDLGPNSLIELVSRDSELVLEIKKGTVTGLEGVTKIKVKKEGKIIQIAQPKKESMLAEVMTKKKEEMSRHCKMVITDADNPNVNAKGEVEVGMVGSCDGLFNGTMNISVFDPSGKEVLKNQSIVFESGNGKKQILKLNAPGTYRVKWENSNDPETRFQIAAELPGFSIPSAKIDCGGRLAWTRTVNLKDAPFDHLQIEVEGVKTQLNVHGSTAVLTGLIQKFPAKLRVKTEARPDELYWVSPFVTIDRLPACNELISPRNKEIVKLNQAISPVLLTWKQQADQKQVKVEVSQDADFKTVLRAEITIHNFSRIKLPKSGKYYWRVTDVTTGDRSDALSFDLVRP
jgi:hypothetical protein